jgi:hypothetical protein
MRLLCDRGDQLAHINLLISWIWWNPALIQGLTNQQNLSRKAETSPVCFGLD